jgi:hypothetical protein
MALSRGTRALALGLALGWTLQVVTSAGRADAGRACAGVELPATLHLNGEPLALNGVGKRTATAFRVTVYVAGLYLPAPSRNPDHILALPHKHLTLHFVRNVGADDLAEALDEGVRNNVPPDKLADARSKMKQVTSRLPTLKKGLRLGFTQRAHDWLEVRVGEELIATIREAGLPALLFTVWLGKRPPDAELRKALLGLGPCV